jgi:hypothetical protein
MAGTSGSPRGARSRRTPGRQASASNADVAAAFTQVADLLEISGDNPFRVRAYRSAARTQGDLPHSAERGNLMTRKCIVYVRLPRRFAPRNDGTHSSSAPC